MVFIYKTAKFAPVWTTILKIWAIFVHQSLTEHACYLQKKGKANVSRFKFNSSLVIQTYFTSEDFFFHVPVKVNDIRLMAPVQNGGPLNDL